MRMSYAEYAEIRRGLRTLRDLSKFPYPRGVLHSILQQKKVDSVKRKYHTFADRIEEIVSFWLDNNAFPKWLTLPPVMKVRLLLKGLGLSVKSINNILRDPEQVERYLEGEKAEKVKEVVRNAVERDYIYSPLAARLQQSRGRLGENILKEELEKLNVSFKTERDLRGVFSKTPDFYFEEPFEFNGSKLRWIESKALFGDPRTHEVYERKQYSRYREMFGEGFVVYWLGCIDTISALDEEAFRNTKKYALLDMRIYVSSSSSIAENFAEKLDAVFVDVSGLDSTNFGESMRIADTIIAAYADGRIVTNCEEKVVRLLKNMGFEIVRIRV